jgi:hypothetical protein
MKKLASKHKQLIHKIQQKFGISDYQMMWIAFGKGLLIGVILL